MESTRQRKEVEEVDDFLTFLEDMLGLPPLEGPASLHKHRCGEMVNGFDSTQGCGHEWDHERPPASVGEAAYDKAHLCPKCGKGPWRYKV